MAEEISGGGYPRQKASWSSASAGQITNTGPVTFTVPPHPLSLGPDPAGLACAADARCGRICWSAGEPCPPLDLPADREPATIEEWLES